MTLPREAYIPEITVKVMDKSSSAIIYLYNSPKGGPAALAFSGRRKKPDWRYRFHTEEQREAKAQAHFEAVREREANRKSRTQSPNTLEIGDILYSSWGYDQTNIDYYQVVDKPSKFFVVIREIGSTIDHSNTGADYMIPNKDQFIGKPKRCKPSADNVVSLSTYSSAYPWDGKPKYQTAAGYGH